MRWFVLIVLGLLVLGCSAGAPPSLVGQPAPDFSLPGTDGKTYALSDYKGKQAVVIAWFPKAFTSHCTEECKSLQSNAEVLGKYDVALFAASVDDPKTNAEFAKNLNLSYPILSDPEKKVATAYGVLGKKGLAMRHTVYIGKDGKVALVDASIQAGSAGQDLAVQLDRLQVPKR